MQLLVFSLAEMQWKSGMYRWREIELNREYIQHIQYVAYERWQLGSLRAVHSALGSMAVLRKNGFMNTRYVGEG